MQKIDELYENLFVPWSIRDIEIKNKIVACAMDGIFLFGWKELEENRFHKETEKFLLEIANHHVGLMMIGIAPIKHGTLDKWLYEKEDIFKKLEEFISKIHKAGAKVFLQLTTGMTAEKLEQEDLHKITDAFAKTAKLCKDAGADGLEIQERYLFTPSAIRFPAKFIQAIKQSCGEDFPVSICFSTASQQNAFYRGAVLEEEFGTFKRDLRDAEQAVIYLQGAGYDMLNVNNIIYDSSHLFSSPIYLMTNCNLDEAAHLKEFIDIPVICTGRMEPEVAAVAVGENFIDAMGVSRQFLTDVEWITKILENRAKDIHPCISCHNACLNMQQYKNDADDDEMYTAHCALNPCVMGSEYGKIEVSDTKKKIAIVGGGVAGMEAAILCAKRGHQVTLYEKFESLGGMLYTSAAQSYKEHERLLISWYEREIKKYSIVVKCYTKVNNLDELKADEIIVATGKRKRKLSVKGIEKAMDSTEYLSDDLDKIGKNVVVIGGGVVGCEVAYELFLRRKHPTIVEIEDDIIRSDKLPFPNTTFFHDFFAKNKIPVYLESCVKEIKDDVVVIADKNGTITKLAADDVIISIGYESDNTFTPRDHVHVVGAANGLEDLYSVIRNVWELCMKL